MKTDILLSALLIVLLWNCKAPAYLPASGDIVTNPWGSRIIVNRSSGPDISGELIAADSLKIVVLTDINYARRLDRTIQVVPVNEIKNYKLYYARPNRYWWTIPAFTAATLSHGYILVFSAPVNLLLTGLVTLSNTFRYKKRDLTLEEMKMFARFPQGIPAHLDLNSLK